MKLDDILAVRNAEPFRPFDIVLSNGRALAVDWKEAVSFTPSKRHVVVDIGSAFSFLEMPSIAELRVRPSSRPSPFHS